MIMEGNPFQIINIVLRKIHYFPMAWRWSTALVCQLYTVPEHEHEHSTVSDTEHYATTWACTGSGERGAGAGGGTREGHSVRTLALADDKRRHDGTHAISRRSIDIANFSVYLSLIITKERER